MRNQTQIDKVLNTKNNLIQFQVTAPYDGCFWCWEFAFISESGKIHFLKFDSQKKWNDNIVLTSASGLEYKCKRDLYDSVKSNKDVFIYNIENNSIKEFIKESNPNDVHSIATILHEEYDISLQTKCSECGQTVDIYSMVSTGYKGDGGIGIEFTDYICDECYSMGCCSECGEYYGRKELNYNEETGEDLCEYCAPECVICGNNTTNEHHVCDDCIEEYQTEYDEFLQKLEDQKTLKFTPTFEGIELRQSKLEFSV